tara:strand:+ start:129 stop:275 length:147 start_codon:yes stop_codon:yes gene_type:complete
MLFEKNSDYILGAYGIYFFAIVAFYFLIFFQRKNLRQVLKSFSVKDRD